MSDKLSAAATWQAAKANITKRDSCKQHLFNPEEYAFGKFMTCQNCGCKAPIHYIAPYIAGFVAHGGDANDIWPEWEGSPQKAAASGG
jgi:hypothetical protein